MKNLQIVAIEQIQGSFKAASDDCRDEETGLRDNGELDINMLHGALFHARQGVAKLQRLIDVIESEPDPM